MTTFDKDGKRVVPKGDKTKPVKEEKKDKK